MLADRLAEWVRTRGESVERVTETHLSVLAFSAQHTYKVKKAVAYGFVDLSTPELRTAVLDAELALNRRFSSDVYLARLALPPTPGEPPEPVLVLRRLPDAQRLATIARSGGGAECVAAVAARLASVHDASVRSAAINACATTSAMQHLWAQELDEVRRFVGSVLDADVATQVERDAAAYVAGRSALFDARIAAGRIVDGHGDLLADDVFCLPDGPRVLDCLEFSETLRCGDAVADAAFLAMDLEHLGRPDLAEMFLSEFRRRTDDGAPPSLVDHHIAYRAHVRAKVACLRVEQGDAQAAESARSHLVLAAAHLRRGRIRLVLVGGLPGTGKSTVAARLGERLGTVVLRSDVVRKELAGIAPDTRATSAVGTGLYSADRTDATYAALLQRAEGLLGLGHSVVLDATWASAALRHRAAAVAHATHSELVAVECRCPADLADARIAKRAATTHDPSDATAAVRRAMATTFDAWPDAIGIDTSSEVDLSALPDGVRP